MSSVSRAVGNILDQSADVIVNAWNRNFIPWWLLLPQGVSGAIKKRGGYQPFRELAAMGLLEPGEARLTSAGRLPYRGIIHVAALNAFWRSNPEIIRSCVVNALELASEERFSSVAIPLLGAGTGGVPPQVSEEVIVSAARTATFAGEVTVVAFGGG
jgi:O-acetyl-ADP-ribose deacetylase (regulator of RNase III)